MDFWTVNAILGAAVAAPGGLFCFVFAGALATERKPEDNAHEMYNLFGITPDNAHEFIH